MTRGEYLNKLTEARWAMQEIRELEGRQGYGEDMDGADCARLAKLVKTVAHALALVDEARGDPDDDPFGDAGDVVSSRIAAVGRREDERRAEQIAYEETLDRNRRGLK